MPTRVVQFSLLLLFLFWMTALALSESRGAAIEFQTVEEKKAVEAFEKGRIAAAQKQWDLAIRYFQEADAGFPVLYLALFLNLGLAHANAGHEVLAMAWLHAYLYAKPQAPNVEALRKELRRLEVVTESKISNIMQRVVASARTIQDEIKRESTLGTLAGYQAETGAIEQAERNLPKWDPGLDILWQR